MVLPPVLRQISPVTENRTSRRNSPIAHPARSGFQRSWCDPAIVPNNGPAIAPAVSKVPSTSLWAYDERMKRSIATTVMSAVAQSPTARILARTPGKLSAVARPQRAGCAWAGLAYLFSA
jgi:hypothetical protein